MEAANRLKTGTTTLGIKCTDGVVLASESKATAGFLIAHKETQKVFQIEDRMGLTTAGSVADAQILTSLIKAEISLYKLERGGITVKAVSNLLSNILFSYKIFPYMVELIVGGVDKTGPHLYVLDPIGSNLEDKFISTGSGSLFAYGVLEDKFKENMTIDEGIELAVHAIKAARERDAMSGGKRIWVAKITEKAFEFVPEEEINKLLK